MWRKILNYHFYSGIGAAEFLYTFHLLSVKFLANNFFICAIWYKILRKNKFIYLSCLTAHIYNFINTSILIFFLRTILIR